MISANNNRIFKNGILVAKYESQESMLYNDKGMNLITFWLRESDNSSTKISLQHKDHLD